MSSPESATPEDREAAENENEEEGLSQKLTPTAGNMFFPAETFLKAAISLKEQVVEITWKGGRIENAAADPTVYTGLMGTAFTCFRAYQVTGNQQELILAGEIIDRCAVLAPSSSSRHVTFLCGRGGVFALGAVVSYYRGDHRRCDLFLNRFFEVSQEKALPVGPEEGGFGMSYDLLYGRAGFLWAALFINKHLGAETLPYHKILMPIVDAVLAGGRAGASDNTSCPLMYRWHGTRYWGAANGLAGILQVLLHFPIGKEDAEDVRGTLRYMMGRRFPSSGNYPSSEGNSRDKLVQWSHGACGMAITLCKASQVFGRDREFSDAAIEAGEVVWKNGLGKKIGLADGIAGNSYVFLSLYRLTGESMYRDRAKAYASYLYQNSTSSGDHSCSLFHGLAGVACLWFDLYEPDKSRFPGYEL